MDNYNLEKDYEVIANRLFMFFKEANLNGISTTCDCCYLPLCSFKGKEEELFSLLSKNKLRFHCNQSPIDINNKGKAWRCYGLYSLLNTDINKFENENQLRMYFNRRISILDNIVPYEECNSCKYWKNPCYGGCYTIRLKTIDNQLSTLKNFVFPIDDDVEVLNCMPQKADNLIIKNDKKHAPKVMINKHMVQADDNMMAFLEVCNGKTTLHQMVEIWKSNFSAIEVARKTIVSMCRDLFEKDFITITYDFNYKSKKLFFN